MEQTKNGVLVINGVCRRKYGRLGHLFASEYARKIASPFGATSAWLLTGAGVLMIALVFYLSIRKPELTAVRKAMRVRCSAIGKRECSGLHDGVGLLGGELDQQRGDHHEPCRIFNIIFPDFNG